MVIMSAWIKSDQALRAHPKTHKLARTLGVRPAEAIGILHCLWWWCLDYASDGNLTDIDVDVIAAACEWEGDANVLIDALVSASVKKGGDGFLENGNGLWVHDWSEYGGAILTAREVDAERKRLDRAKAGHRTSSGRRSDGGRREDKNREEKKELRASGPVDNSTVRPVARSDDHLCWRCGAAITNDDILDDKCVTSSRGIRHKDCAP